MTSTARRVVARGREDGPDSQPDFLGAHAPLLRQVLHDAESPPANRCWRRMTRVRHRRASAVADRDFDRTAVEHPGDLQLLAGKRISVQDRVTEQLADDQSGISDRVLEYARGDEFLRKRPAC